MSTKLLGTHLLMTFLLLGDKQAGRELYIIVYGILFYLVYLVSSLMWILYKLNDRMMM